jgi:hypothetical protein
MPDIIAEKATKTAENLEETQTSRKTAGDGALQRCYQQIGIPAVAAAARYQGTAKNPAYAPAADHSSDLAEEAAV